MLSSRAASEPPSRPAPPEPSEPERAVRARPRLRRLGWLVLGLQLAGMLAFNTVQYSRFALTKDFAGYSQAWWAIAHGHLDPWSTAFGIRFWRNNSEFAIWLLSPLYHLYPSSIVLLWVQDVVVVATELVAFGWILAYLARSRLSPRAAELVGIGVLVVLLADPWVYETIGFDVHLEVFAALFALLAGRDLWAGRTRRLWAWVPLTLISEALGGVYLVGVGISGILAGRGSRRAGLLLVGSGLGWMLLLGLLGGSGFGGHGIDRWYGYLVGHHAGHVSVLDILVGVLRHPASAVHMMAKRWSVVFEFLAAVGLVGVASPWGLGPALVVFLPNVLNADPDFSRLVQSFQSWAAIPFVLVGSVMLLVRLATSGRIGRFAGVAGLTLWTVLLGRAAGAIFPTLGPTWIGVSPPAAADLAALRRVTPLGTEVVASNGVIGRFGTRPYVYPLGYSSRTAAFGGLASIPVKSSTVLFVISSRQGTGELSPAETEKALSYVEDHLHAHLVLAKNGIYALRWSPPPGTRHVF